MSKVSEEINERAKNKGVKYPKLHQGIVSHSKTKALSKFKK